MTDKVYKYMSVQISNITKVCVQNVLRVLECNLEDVDATAWSLHRWTPGGNGLTLRSGVTSVGQLMYPAAIHAPAASPKFGLLVTSAMIFFFTVPFLLPSILIKLN